MTERFLTATFAALFAAIPLCTSTVAAVPGRDSVALIGHSGQRTYTLGRRNLFTATDSLFRAGRLLARNDAYAIDYSTGEVYFSAPLADGDTVIALFKALVVDLPGAMVYLPLSIVDTMPAAADSATAARRPTRVTYLSRDTQDMAQTGGSQVRFGGSKTFSIAAGTGRDLSLDQALNVSADGRLAPDLEVSASLSDRNLPLTQAGSTEELSQLDRMFIQARARSWSMALGDFDIAYPELSLLQLNRQLEGLQAEGRMAGASLAGAYSLSKGKAEINRFAGQEGKQGPYKMTVSDGTTDFVVLANSQKVWLDGELLQPGASSGYTMDYDRAELTFTPRRPITRDSRIVVEFQYSAEGYRRSLYFANARVPAGRHFTLRAAYLQETDDPDRPSGEALSDSQRAAIARAGNDTARLWVEGGTKVDSGSGAYVKPDSFYVFVGPGRGNYSVTFTVVGPGSGDYAFDNALGGFRYTGAGHGDYTARKRLVSPQSQSVASLRTDLSWTGGAAFIEGSGSRLASNTLSADRTGGITGTAGKAQLAWKRDSLDWGGFEVRAGVSSISRRYRNTNMAREPDFETTWGLGSWSGLRPADPFAVQQSFDINAAYRLFSYAAIGGSWGRLGFFDGRWGRKYKLTTDLTLPGLPLVHYQRARYLLGNAWAAATGGTGRRDLNQVNTAWSAGAWELNAGFLHDLDQFDRSQDGTSGIAYWEASLGWARGTDALRFGQSLQRRDDSGRDSLTGGWTGRSYTTTVTSTVRISRPQRLNVALDHTFRQTRSRPGVAGQDVHSHLAALHADYNGLREMVRLSLDYNLSAVEAALRQERYYRVPVRSGDYSYDPLSGTFYPDTIGDYRRTLVDLAAVQMTAENTLKSFISVTPTALPGPWKGFRLDGVLSAGIKAPRSPDFKQLTFQRDRLWQATNINSSLDAAGDLSYTAVSGWTGKMHLRWKRESDNQNLGRHQGTRASERRADLFLPLAALWRASLFAEYNTASVSSAEYGLETSTATMRGGADAGYQIDPALELAGKAEAVRERLQRLVSNPLAATIAITAYTVAPYLTRQLGLAGRIRVEAGLVARSADRGRDQIPAEFSITRPLGLTKTWALQYDYRISTVLTSSAGYDGRKEPDKQPVHNARFELRAYF